MAGYSSLRRGLSVERRGLRADSHSVCGSEATAERIHIYAVCIVRYRVPCMWDFQLLILMVYVGARPYYTKHHSVGALYARGPRSEEVT